MGTLTAAADASDVAGNAIASLGDSISTTNVMSRNLDLRQGYRTQRACRTPSRARPRSSARGGSTSRLSRTRSRASFPQHPQGARYDHAQVRGGGRATITRARARQDGAIRERPRGRPDTVRRDIEMNLNLFLRPQEAKEELDAKSTRHDSSVFVETGYEMLMTQGTDLVDAIVRSSRCRLQAESSGGGGRSEINVQTVFGALSTRLRRPQPSAACKYASASSATSAARS